VDLNQNLVNSRLPINFCAFFLYDDELLTNFKHIPTFLNINYNLNHEKYWNLTIPINFNTKKKVFELPTNETNGTMFEISL
jgi:hypothetical protein